MPQLLRVQPELQELRAASRGAVVARWACDCSHGGGGLRWWAAAGLAVEASGGACAMRPSSGKRADARQPRSVVHG